MKEGGEVKVFFVSLNAICLFIWVSQFVRFYFFGMHPSNFQVGSAMVFATFYFLQGLIDAAKKPINERG